MSSRPWYRLHAATWIIAAAVVVALAIANLLGEKCVRFVGVGPEFRYGWPLGFAYSPAIDAHAEVDVEAKPWFDRQRVREFDLLSLSTNVFVAIFVIAGSAATTEWWRRGASSAIQFNLKWMFAAMLLVAYLMAEQRRPSRTPEDHLLDFATLVAALGATWACVGAFKLAGSASKRITDRRRQDAPEAT